MSLTLNYYNHNSRFPDHLRGLLRHFADLRDGTHGDGEVTRADKERLFGAAVSHLDRYPRQALTELNDALLLGSGTPDRVRRDQVAQRRRHGPLDARLAGAGTGGDRTGRPGSLLRAQLPPSPPARRDSGSLASQRVQ